MKAIRLIPLVLTASLLSGATAGAVTLIYDNFNSVASGSGVNNRTPTISAAGGNWMTNSTLLSGNGAGGLNVSYSDTRNISIDLGSAYFTTNPGVYELSLTITSPADFTGTSWIGMGFTQGYATSASPASASVTGQPWFVYRQNGGVDVYAGPQNTGLLTNGSGQPSLVATVGTPHTFTLRLDTSAPQWTLQFLVDGALADLGAEDNPTYTFSSNPSIRYLMVAVGGGTASGTGVIDDFTFTGPIPEPATSLLTLVSATAFLRRRRR